MSWEDRMEGLQNLLDDRFPDMVAERLDDIVEQHLDSIIEILNGMGYVVEKRKEVL
jgi:hypothetical protein